ncbi:MAG: response regulator transcription factor [Ignavibacteriae bacterium]|nr:DNA-binding response regulator [Ignavibacteriota bacterium]NOG99251.1 response regulator transcription factor [Ignavibacteriota bacterium]
MGIKTKIKLLLADSYYLFRKSLVNILNDDDGILIVGDIGVSDNISSHYFNSNPDVIVADMKQIFEEAKNPITYLIDNNPDVKILFLAEEFQDDQISFALNIKADGIISKDITESEFIYAIHEIYDGRKYFDNYLSSDRRNDLMKRVDKNQECMDNDTIPLLNYREEQILKLINLGLTSAQIAEKLKLSKRTIDNYRIGLKKILKVNSRAEMMVLAHKYFNNSN